MLEAMTVKHQLLMWADEPDVEMYRAIMSRHPDVQTHIETLPDGFVREAQTAEIIFVARGFDGCWLATAPRLQWLHIGGTGIDRLHPLSSLPPDLIVTNTPGLNAPMMADYVVCTLLMLTWNFPQLLRNQMAARWEHWGTERVAGKVLTIVGMGNVGREVARRGHALGMRIWGIRRSPGPMLDVERMGGMDQIIPFFRESDYAVLAVPLTTDTRGLIGHRELEATKRSAFLINVSRGSIIQQSALIAALKAGNLAGAALDVFEVEPLPPGSELWTLPNVIITPHVSSWSPDYRARAAEMFDANLRRYISGKPLLNVIDRAKGY